MSPRPTIVDVAEAAGVSVGTASNALSGKGRVSGATRARVAKAAEELAFVPHRGASGLPTGRTMSIGIRFGHDAAIPGGDFFIEMLDAAADAADRAGYGLLIRRSGRPQTALVDGHIVVDPTASDPLSESEHGVPVVTIGRNRTNSVPWVDVDHRAAMSTLLGHLAGRAGEGPVWFVALPQHLGFVDALEDGFHRWVEAEGREGVVLRSSDAALQVVDLVQLKLEESGKPALIVTALDRQAVGVQYALSAANLTVPVGSASDGVALGFLVPPVSAMALDGAKHGVTAIRMLLDWIRTGEVPQSVTLPARLRVR
jgi:DNA-binding LacI/PurR family transcriptional regulator